MTAKAHYKHRMRKLKDLAAFSVVLLFCLVVWGIVGYCCWTVIKSAP